MGLLPSTKEDVHVFARFCLSVCLLSSLLENACMDLDEMLRVACRSPAGGDLHVYRLSDGGERDVGTWTN